MNETINGMIEQIKARKNKKFGKAPVILISYNDKISTIERTELPDTCDALLITVQAHPSQEKRLRNVFTTIREYLYGFDGWLKYKDQVIEPSIVFTTGQCFTDNVILFLIKEFKILRSSHKEASDVPTNSELQEKMDRITEECNKALNLKQYEDNVGPVTKSFRERYREYWGLL